MSIKFTADTMTCATSGHTAHRDDAGAWSVSYLPGRTFDRNDAITALTIAEAVASITADKAKYDRVWPHIMSWAGEIGMDAAAAVTAASAVPGAQRACGR